MHDALQSGSFHGGSCISQRLLTVPLSLVVVVGVVLFMFVFVIVFVLIQTKGALFFILSDY